MAAILVLTGASGSGKTTLLRALEAMEIPGLACFQCDTIYGDLPETIRADGEAAQDAILEHWARYALDKPALLVAVLDTQIRPQRALAMLRRLGITTHRVVLVECRQAEREARLHGPRGQPELANPQMECWAAYLRGQADVLGLERIDTTYQPVTDCLALLCGIAEPLMKRRSEQECGGRLVIVCGLPGSGKTTYAMALAAEIPNAVRFCPDDWLGAAGISLWDEVAREQIESCQWQVARGILLQGGTAIIEWGTWGRSERDALRLDAMALRARVELYCLDLPLEVLLERVRGRNLESPEISLDDLRQWSAAFERPDNEEMRLFDAATIVKE